MLLFPLFLLIIQLSLINARSTNNSTLKISRRSTPKVYDVELVLRQAQNDNDFDDPPPTRSSVVYPSSAAIIPEDEGDGIDPLGSLDDEDDVIDGEDKEIKRMPSRFYRRRFGNRYVRPFVGGMGMPTMGGGMPTMGGGGGIAPFGYGMRRPGGMALGGMNINGMGGMNGNMGPMGSAMTGGGGMGMPMNGGGMGSGMMNGNANGNDGMNGGGGGGMGPDGSDGSDDIAYPSRFNYRRPFPMIPNPDGMRGNGINGYGTSYGPNNNNLGNNGNWFNNNNNNNYGDGFNGGVGYGYQFRGGMMGGGGNGMGPSPGGYGPSGSSSCGPMGCGNGGSGGNNGMMGSNMGGGGQGMMRPGNSGPGGFYMGGFPGGPSMIGRGGMGMGMNGGWNGPMGANMGGGGGDDGDGGMGDGMMGGGGGMNGDGPPTGAVGIHMSNNGYSYAAYIERQVRSTTIMMYTLVGCAPCQRAKHMLAVHYADVKSHFLELVGDEDWQRQLQVDLQHVTGAMTFPYIFVCGNYIGGSTDLIALHQSGQLRRMVNSCSRKVVAKAAVAAVAASV